MSRTISFSVPDHIYEAIRFAAHCKWKSPSEYVKDATAAYLKKYPPNGLLRDIALLRGADPKNPRADGDSNATTPALPDEISSREE